MPQPATTHEDLLRIQAFLSGIGLVMHLVDEPVEGFLPGVRTSNGELVVGRGADADSVLHEAGHLATTPQPFRAWMTDNLARGQEKMAKALVAANLDPEAALVRHSIQCSDPEATAWAFAAGRALGLPDEQVILDASYDGEGAFIRQCLALNAYPGINGLVHAGMCANGMYARAHRLPAYPQMLRWIQDGPYPEWTPPPPGTARRPRPV